MLHSLRPVALVGLAATAVLCCVGIAPAQPQPRPAQAGRPAAARDVELVVTLTLPDAVLIGMRKNRAIRSQYLQRIADKFALYVAEDTFNPKSSLIAAVTRARQAGTNLTVYNLGPSVTWALPTGAVITGGIASVQTNVRGQRNAGLAAVTFQAVQPLLRGGGFDIASAPIRVGRLQEQANKLRLQQNVSETITQIILAYRAVIQSGEQAKIARDGLKRARDLLEINKVLISAGRLAAMEIVQSQASIAQQELSLATAQNAYEQSKASLLTLIAVDSSTQVTTVDKLTATPVKVDEATAIRTALDRQPAYLTQLVAIEVSRINLELAKNQRLWDVSIVASGAQQGASNNTFGSIGELPSRRPDYTVGLQLSVPLRDPAREQGEVNASVALRQADLQVAQLRDQISQQVRDGVRNIAITGGQLDTARRFRELAEQQLDIEVTKLQVGRSSNFAVVSFQNALQQAQTQELTAVITYLNALTILDQVLGTTLETWGIEPNDR